MRLWAVVKSHIEIAIFAVAAVGAWPIVLSFDAQALMRIIYPLLVGLYMMAVGIKVWRYMAIERTAMAVPMILVLVSHGVAMLVLALSVGESPIIRLSEYRWLIVYARLLVVAAVAIACGKGLHIIIKNMRKGN